MMVRHLICFKDFTSKSLRTYKDVYMIYVTDEDFTCVKPPPKKARTAVSERNHKTTSASPNEVVDPTSSGSSKRLQKAFLPFQNTFHAQKSINVPLSVCNESIDPLLLCYFRTSLDDKLYDRDLETALILSLLNSPRTQDEEPTTKTGEYSAGLSTNFPHSWSAKLYFTVIYCLIVFCRWLWRVSACSMFSTCSDTLQCW